MKKARKIGEYEVGYGKLPEDCIPKKECQAPKRGRKRPRVTAASSRA